MTGHFEPQHEGRAAAVVQIKHPARAHAQAVSDTSAGAVERHVGHLGVGDQHVDIGDDVLAMSLEEAGSGSLHHVDRGFVGPDVMPELRRAEHQVSR